MSESKPPPHIPSKELLYALFVKYDRRAKGRDPDPKDKPYDGPKCWHGNPKGNCFDCEGP